MIPSQRDIKNRLPQNIMARNRPVDILQIVICDEVLCQGRSITQTLYHRVHEARVTKVTETGQRTTLPNKKGDSLNHHKCPGSRIGKERVFWWLIKGHAFPVKIYISKICMFYFTLTFRESYMQQTWLWIHSPVTIDYMYPHITCISFNQSHLQNQ